MGAYKSISPLHVTQPYILPLSKREVHSFEGLCYFLQMNWFEAIICLETEHLTKFIENQLELPLVAKELEKTELSYLTRFKKLFEVSALVHKDYDAFYHDITLWDDKTKYDQYKTLGDAFYNNEQYVKALSYYIKAKDIDATANVYNNIGLVHMKLMDYALAEKAFKDGILILESEKIYYNIIQLYKNQRRLDEALELIYKIVEKYKSAELLFEAGDISLKKKKYNQALLYFLKSYELEPNLITQYRVLKTRIEAKQLKSAMEQLETLKSKDLFQYYLLKGKIYERAKHMDVAIETIEEGIKIVGQNKAFYLYLAKLYRLNNQIIKAIQAVTWLSEQHMTGDDVIYEMALIAKQAGQYADYNSKIDQLVGIWKKDARYRLSY